MSIAVNRWPQREEDCLHGDSDDDYDDGGTDFTDLTDGTDEEDNGRPQQHHQHQHQRHQQNGKSRISAVWTQQQSSCQIKIASSPTSLHSSPPANTRPTSSRMASTSSGRRDGNPSTSSSSFTFHVARLFKNKLFALFATTLLVLITSAILLFIIVTYYQLSGGGGGTGEGEDLDSVSTDRMERAVLNSVSSVWLFTFDLLSDFYFLSFSISDKTVSSHLNFSSSCTDMSTTARFGKKMSQGCHLLFLLLLLLLLLRLTYFSLYLIPQPYPNCSEAAPFH